MGKVASQTLKYCFKSGTGEVIHKSSVTELVTNVVCVKLKIVYCHDHIKLINQLTFTQYVHRHL